MKRPQAARMNAIADLDNDEMVEGYLDGFKGWPEPGDNRSYSYWHGWTKGALDGGYRDATPADGELARDYVQRSARP